MSDAAPQVEDGFVRIANELFDAILLAPLSKRELLVVMAVIRKTYGYGKKSDDMTMTQIAEITGLTRPHVSETVRDLASKNVFLIRDGEYGKVIGIQKNYKKWDFDNVPETGQSQNGTRPKSGNAPSRNGNKTVPKREMSRPETGHTIDNPNKQLQKTIPKDSCAAPTAPTWQAYSLSYQERYGVPPTRNAKVNGQLAQFCQRVPHDEAPEIAAFYVRHNAAFYVRTGHAVGAMLNDSEKLRTEWATQRAGITQITQSPVLQHNIAVAEEFIRRGNA